MFSAVISVPSSFWAEMATIQSDVQGREGGDLRSQFWTIAVRMFLANPILGVGMNNFPHNVMYYETEAETKVVGHSFAGTVAHSLYFTLLAELGLCGTLIFGGIVYFNFRDILFLIKGPYAAVPNLKNNDRSDIKLQVVEDYDQKVIRQCALAIGGGLIGYLVCGAFITVLTYSHFWILTALIVGLKEANSQNLLMTARNSDGIRLSRSSPPRNFAAINPSNTRAI
jgi:O-antigen ligase